MAKLDDVVASLNIKLNKQEQISNNILCGIKRRPWLVSEESSPSLSSFDTHCKEESIDPNYSGSISGSIDPNYSGSISGSIDPNYSGSISGSIDPNYSGFRISINQLRGNPLKLVQYFFEISKNETQNLTKKITRREITQDLNISIDSLKTALKFLVKNGLIKRVNFCTGKTGYSQYRLEEKLFFELKTAYQLGSINRVYIGSRSNNISNKTTTTPPPGDPHSFIFDLNPLSNIGLNLNHINQIINFGKLTSEQIQECIDHFAFDLEYNDRAKGFKLSPLDVFMGMLRKGNYYNAPYNYESPKARNLRLSLEAKTKRQAQEMEIEQKLKESEYKDWIEQLPDSELVEFYIEEQDISNVPEKIQKTLIRRNALNNARQYFDSEIWPKRKKELETQTG